MYTGEHKDVVANFVSVGAFCASKNCSAVTITPKLFAKFCPQNRSKRKQMKLLKTRSEECSKSSKTEAETSSILFVPIVEG